MKRPSFQFYPGDWQSDLKLRRCSPAARGVWVDLLCAFHDSDDGYGLLRWPLKDIANTIGASMSHVRELVDKGVLRGSDAEITEPLIYTPRSGRKDGEPVTLIATQAGPLWYSKRLVKDEYVRTIRGESTRFGEGEGESPKPARKHAPKPPLGDGTPSSSSSSSSPTGRKARKRATPLPESFGISDRVRAWAASKGLNHLDEQLEALVSYARRKGATYVDWDEALMTAIRDDWAKVNKPGQQSSDIFAGAV